MVGYRKFSIPVALLLGVAAAPAMASTVVGSGAYGISVDLSVLNSAITAGVPPLASVSDLTADTSYSDAGHLVNAGVNSFTLASVAGLGVTNARLGVSSGVIDTTATGGPIPASQLSDGTALVNNFNLSIATYLGASVTPLLTLLSLSADTIGSTAHASGTPSAGVSGSSRITNLTLTVAGINLVANSNLLLSAPANTDLLGFLHLAPITGLRIIVNEQILPTSNDASGARITTNALHFIFAGFSLIGGKAIRGDVIVSQSRAFIESANSATPEPAVWAQMIAGFGLIGLASRRRRTVLNA